MTSPLYRDAGVVLRTYKLGEADRIVVILTAENGKVRAVANGVRKTRSRFGARLEPMSHVRLQLYRGRELDKVTQADAVETTGPLLADLDKATQGLALLEAVDQMTMEREPNPALYRMLVGALRTLAERSSPLVVPAFFWKLLSAEGVRPELDLCIACGRGEAAAGGYVAFDLDGGGVTCRTCRRGQALSPGALGLMRDILGGRLNAVLAGPPRADGGEVAHLATRAVEHHIERRLRAVAMFEDH